MLKDLQQINSSVLVHEQKKKFGWVKSFGRSSEQKTL